LEVEEAAVVGVIDSEIFVWSPFVKVAFEQVLRRW
jgi:hypothetical protein